MNVGQLFIRWALLLLPFASSLTAEAQQPTKIPRIGYIATAGDSNNPGLIVQAFQQGLRDLGYIEAKT